MGRVIAFLLVSVALVLGFAMPASADFYKWVDRDGKEFYTNDREKIPAEYRSSAKPVEVRDDRVSVGATPSAGGSQPVKVSEHKDKYGRGEEYWRKRAENLRRQIREKQDDYDLIVRQEQHDEQKVGKKSSRSKSRTSTAASRNKKKAELEKKISRLRHELEVELPEEARKADAYPGWLRD